MRKIWMSITVGVMVSVSVICGYHYLQNGREMMVYNSYSMTADNYHKEYLTVVVNQLVVSDQMECAEKIIQKCRDNDFGNVQFSYDYSIPSELQVDVYLSKRDVKKGNEAFSFAYEKEKDNQYNIIDNPEKYEIVLEPVIKEK
jgi:hypothetical protein